MRTLSDWSSSIPSLTFPHRAGGDSSAPSQANIDYAARLQRARSDSIHTSDYSDDPLPEPTRSRSESPVVYDDDSADDDDFDPTKPPRSPRSPKTKFKRFSGPASRHLGRSDGTPVHTLTCHASAVSRSRLIWCDRVAHADPDPAFADPGRPPPHDVRELPRVQDEVVRPLHRQDVSLVALRRVPAGDERADE